MKAIAKPRDTPRIVLRDGSFRPPTHSGVREVLAKGRSKDRSSRLATQDSWEPFVMANVAPDVAAPTTAT